MTYAHNTFISYLYELGIFGVAALTWVFISNLYAALRVTRAHRFPVVACHIGFIILNLSTMALWTLEGAMLYGLVLGYTWCFQPLGHMSQTNCRMLTYERGMAMQCALRLSWHKHMVAVLSKYSGQYGELSSRCARAD